MSWSAKAMASSPDRHTLLMVIEGTDIGIPACTAAWRDGICPAPACSTWPMITYCTWSGVTPERSRAAFMATPPRSMADWSFNAPSSRPIGVRAPWTMTLRSLIATSSSHPNRAERPAAGTMV